MTTSNAAGAGTHLTVMTYNLYIGTDLKPVLLAATNSEFDNAFVATLAGLTATDMEARARAIAHEIAAVRPDLIGLQEVVVWQSDPGGIPPSATPVTLDFLALLLDALIALHLHYEPLVVDPGACLTASVDPVVTFTNRNVVLARTASMSTPGTVAHLQSATFKTNVIVPNPRLGSVSITRGWAAATINLGSTQCHFVTVHLEDSHPAVQAAQADELIHALRIMDGPLILVGDFNAEARTGSSTYAKFIAAGFRDAWAELWPADPGYTCCQAEHLQNPVSSLTQRIDWILVRGAVDPVAAFVVGGTPSSRTPTALWPSDHAGVVAKLHVH